MSLALPFVGRRKEAGRLRELGIQRKHALIIGADGIGKSALVASLRDSVGLLVCPASERMSEICESLERGLGLDAVELKLTARKNRILHSLERTVRIVVFDGLGWTTPKLSAFIEAVCERVPVWLCARSEHSWDIGHIWPLLVRFERVELRPFRLSETRALVEAAVRLRVVPSSVMDGVERLHYFSAGNPRILCDLLTGLAGGRYDPRKIFDLRLLNLDRRIQQLPPCGAPRPVRA